MSFVASFIPSAEEQRALKRAIERRRSVADSLKSYAPFFVLLFVSPLVALAFKREFVFLQAAVSDWRAYWTAFVEAGPYLGGVAVVYSAIEGVSRRWRRNSGQLDRAGVSVDLDADGLTWDTNGVIVRVRWSKVQLVELTNEHLVVLVTPESGVAVPRRGFSSGMAFDEAGKYALEKCTASRSAK